MNFRLPVLLLFHFLFQYVVGCRRRHLRGDDCPLSVSPLLARSLLPAAGCGGQRLSGERVNCQKRGTSFPWSWSSLILIITSFFLISWHYTQAFCSSQRGSYSLITSFSCLHWVPNQPAAVHFFNRILKKGRATQHHPTIVQKQCTNSTKCKLYSVQIVQCANCTVCKLYSVQTVQCIDSSVYRLYTVYKLYSVQTTVWHCTNCLMYKLYGVQTVQCTSCTSWA